MVSCTANTEVRPCYDGFTETEGKGTCKRGQQTCNADGTGFGECVGEVLPAMADDCAKGLDTTCDGKLSCPCTPKATKSCYDGLPATSADVGICKRGIRTCDDDGKGFGDCVGQIKPDVENCLTPDDENCDGLINGPLGGCVCETPGEVSDCTGALPGVCAGGTHVCAADGKSYGECTSKLMPSFEDCFTTDDEDCDGKPAVACMGTSSVAGSAGTASGDDSVFGVASDAAGNIFIGGVSGSSQGINYAVTTGAAEITKLDKNGVQIWKKTYPSAGGGGYSVVRGVTVDGTGSVFLIGEYVGTISANGVSLTSTQVNIADVFVVKLAADGSLKWSKSYGGLSDHYGAGISAAANGDVFLIGSMSGTMNFGASMLTTKGSTDVFVARLDGATGDAKWSKNFGDNAAQRGRDIAATSDGNMVATGQFDGTINFGGGDLLGGSSNENIFLTKLDGANGNQVWAKSFGDLDDQIGYSVAADNKGNIVLTGTAAGKTDFGGGLLGSSSSGQIDFFIASFASDGSHRWSKVFGDNNPQAGRDVAVDAAGNVLLTGHFTGTINFDNTTTLTNSGTGSSLDVFVAKFKGSDGTLGWARSFGDTMNDQLGRSITADPSANAIVGGTFKGGIDFGPPTAPLTSTSSTFDTFWVKLAP